MAKDKFYEARMQGMIYASNIVKEKGIDALRKEIEMRGVYKVPLTVKAEQFDELLAEICTNTRETVFTLTFDTLNKEFGFGEKRLQQFADEFNKRFNACIDFDYTGEHYVSMEDFAVELKQKYKNLLIDVQRVAMCQDSHDEADPNFKNHTVINGIINALKLGGFDEAAEFLEKKK
jgi:hypothetical protein